MYKTASDKTSYLERVASHSTKESRTGLIKAIPEWAQEPEEYYNSLKERWQLILDQMVKAQGQLEEYNKQLRVTLPRKEFEHIQEHRTALQRRYSLLAEEQKELRPLVMAAGEKAWSIVFWKVCERMLNRDDYLIVKNETLALIGREPREIRHSRVTISDTKKKSLKRKEDRRDRRRQSLHRNVFWGKAKQYDVVWSDEG